MKLSLLTAAFTTMGAFIDSQMKRYDEETIERARENIDRLQAMADKEELPLNMYFAEVTFDDIQAKEASSVFNNMPTSLELDNDAVDKLIASGRLLLRHQPDFQRFKANNNGKLSDDALSEFEICKHFNHPNCANAN